MRNPTVSLADLLGAVDLLPPSLSADLEEHRISPSCNNSNQQLAAFPLKEFK
jgi:hypothetical protein